MNSKVKDLIQILIFQAIAAAVAVGSFSVIPNRNIAAIVAGLTFVLFGAFAVYKSVSWGHYFKNLVFWGTIVHLNFGFFMLFNRILNWTQIFGTQDILGVQAQKFHRLSETWYTVLFGIVILELVRTLIKNKKSA